MKYLCVVYLLLCFHSPFLSAQCNTGLNLAYGKPSFASSLENAGDPASNAFDGNFSSRWSSAATDSQYIYVDLGSVYPLCEVILNWEAAFGGNFTIDFSNDMSTWTPAATITGNTSVNDTIVLTGSARYVRMNGTLRATGYGYSLYEFQVYSTMATPVCPVTNLALHQPAIASSTQNAGLAASYAFDGDPATRWASDYLDSQYIYVDAGAVYALCNVTLNWEAAYASSFNIDVSNDALSWTTMSAITGNTVTTNSIALNGSGRYVRMYGITRATAFGFSLYEFSVYGSIILPVTLTGFQAQEQDGNMVLLNWKTQAETNNSFFVVERSHDGQVYAPAGQVPGKGNSGLVSDYAWIDHLPMPGMNYYRLKQVDINGNYSYSPVVSAQIFATSLPTLQVYPNPVTRQVTVRCINSGETIGLVDIYTVTGVRVSQLQHSSGNTLTLSLEKLPAGIYILQVSTRTSRQSFKVNKQ